MPRLSLLLVTLCLPVSGFAAEELWSNGRITRDQPFKAKVIGVQSGWGWDTIILREIDGEGRYCLATFGNPTGTYKVIHPNDFEKGAMRKLGAIFLDPAVEVERFSWSMGVWRHGRIFGDEDAATKHQQKLGEQLGTGQPATPTELKLEDSEKLQPDSEERSR